MKLEKLAKSMLAGASLTAILSALPVAADFHGNGLLPLKASFAYAEEGSGSSGGGDEDNGDDEGDDSGDDEGDDEGDDSGDDEGDDSGDDDEDGDGVSVHHGDDGSSEYVLPDGTKVEISPDRTEVEVKYPDGTKESIENGIYERKDAAGNTVEERAATADDYARLSALLQ